MARHPPIEISTRGKKPRLHLQRGMKKKRTWEIFRVIQGRREDGS